MEYLRRTMTTKNDGFEYSRMRSRVMRQLLVLGATLGVVGAIAGVLASDGGFQRRDDDRRDDEGDGRGRYAIGLWGDLPLNHAGRSRCPESNRGYEYSGTGIHRPRRRSQGWFQQSVQ